jgi:hypothetical protein
MFWYKTTDFIQSRFLWKLKLSLWSNLKNPKTGREAGRLREKTNTG